MINISKDRTEHRVPRRRFLKQGAALGTLATVPALVKARQAEAADKIVFWEYKDPPGSATFQFLEESAKRFTAQTGIEVSIEFKSAEGIEQAVAAAANAAQGFDAILWWSGPTARNQASLGNIVSLNGKFPQETWDNKLGLESLQYEGKQYGITFDVSPWFLVYNREILKKAGLSDDTFPPPNAAPIEWDKFLEVCGKVSKDAGVAPLMFANKEGYFNEWYIYNFEGQSFDSTKEIEDISLGDGSWQHPDVHKALAAYKQLYDAGFFVEGGEVVPYEQHVLQFASGKCAMSVYFDMAGATSAAREAFGNDTIAFTKIPAYRRDKQLFDHVSLEPNSVYIASFGKQQDLAVKWVQHLTSVAELNELARLTQVSPGDRRWDRSLIKDAAIRAVFEGAAEKSQVYPYDFATQAQYDSLLRNGILYLQGQWTAEQLTADWDKVDEEYKKQQKGG